MVLYSTVIYSLQRIGLQNAIGIGQILLRAALTVGVLRAGHGIVGLAAVVVATNLLGWIASILVAYRVLPRLSISLRHANRASARELLGYGGFTTSWSTSATPSSSTPAASSSSARCATRSPSPTSRSRHQLVPYFMSIVQAVTWSFTTLLHRALGDRRGGRRATAARDRLARRRRLRVARRRRPLVPRPRLHEGVQGESFFGHGFEPYFAQSVTCLAILTGATLLRASQSCGRQALFAMREGALSRPADPLRGGGPTVALEACFLVCRYGLPGIAVATLIPVVVTQGFIQPRHLLRELECDGRRFVFDLLRASLPIVAAMALTDALLGARLDAHSWPTLIVRGAVITLPALVVGLFCSTSHEERRAIARFFN